MATTPLIVAGLFKIGAVDFSDAVTSVTLQVDANEIEIPATLSTPVSARKGGNKYSIKLDYLANDTSATAEMWHVIYTAIDSSDGVLTFTLQMRDGSPSATNPQWTGSFVATHAALGGTADTLSADSATFTLTGAPVKVTS